MVEPFARMSTVSGVAAAERRRSPLVYLGISVAACAAVAIAVLLVVAQYNHAAAQQYAGGIWDTHERSSAEMLIDKLIDHQIYNQPQTELNQSFPLTMRVIANPALAIITACRPPLRLQFKARVIAPTMDVENSLDEAVDVPHGVQRFSWMLTPHEPGVQEARVHGIVYCMSPRSHVLARQTAVDEIRAVEVVQPFVLSGDNWTSLGIAVFGIFGSSGVVAFLGGILHRPETKAAA